MLCFANQEDYIHITIYIMNEKKRKTRKETRKGIRCLKLARWLHLMIYEQTRKNMKWHANREAKRRNMCLCMYVYVYYLQMEHRERKTTTTTATTRKDR